MARNGSFADLADHWDEIAMGLHAAPSEAAPIVAPMIAASIHHVFGNDPPLATLAASTQEDRVAQGYSANEPLVRSHALEESYKSAVGEGSHGVVAAAGSNHPLAVAHEHGFFNVRANKMVPPRPAAFLGFTEAQLAAHSIWKNLIGRVVKR